MKLTILCALIEEEDFLKVAVLEETDLNPYGVNAVIPKDFVSDGMSVPRFLWRWLGAKIGAKTLSPSVAHDWLYQSHSVTRQESDAWYRDQLVENGYPRARAWAVWAGLRIFGGSHW